jgi:hypothetical protein
MAGRIAYYGNIVRDGLVLLLDAAKKDSYAGSGTLWRDISGNGNNGTLTNGPTFNSNNGGSIVLDGINDYISSLSLNILSPTNLTIQLWVYPTNIGTGNGYITVFDTPSRNLSLWIGLQYYGLGQTTTFYSGTFNWINNTWYYITMIKSGNTGSIIKNNYEISTIINAGNTMNGQLQFGSNPSGGGTPFAGSYGMISLYNRALTPTEVLQNYNATKNRYI